MPSPTKKFSVTHEYLMNSNKMGKILEKVLVPDCILNRKKYILLMVKPDIKSKMIP